MFLANNVASVCIGLNQAKTINNNNCKDNEYNNNKRVFKIPNSWPINVWLWNENRKREKSCSNGLTTLPYRDACVIMSWSCITHVMWHKTNLTLAPRLFLKGVSEFKIISNLHCHVKGYTTSFWGFYHLHLNLNHWHNRSHKIMHTGKTFSAISPKRRQAVKVISDTGTYFNSWQN